MITEVTTIASTIGGSLIGLFGIYLTFRGNLLQRGTYAKQLHIIEVATKRSEYWTGYLKASKLANGALSESYARAKTEVNDALKRIRDETDAELKRLSWGRQITRSMRKEKHTLAEAKKPSVDWFLFGALWLWSTFGALFFFGFMFASMANGTTEREVRFGGLGLVCATLSGWSRRKIREVKYPEPPAPLIDRV